MNSGHVADIERLEREAVTAKRRFFLLPVGLGIFSLLIWVISLFTPAEFARFALFFAGIWLVLNGLSYYLRAERRHK